NNAALGRLVLDGGVNSLFEFAGPDTNGSYALYVDRREFTTFTALFDADGNCAGITNAPAFRIYYGQALANGISISKNLDGVNGGSLRWVSNYMCGTFS